MTPATEEMLELISDKLSKYFATTKKNATEEQVYKALALVLRDKLLKKKQANNQRIVQGKYKRVYYLCMEFLLGRSLRNNLCNLGLEDSAREALKSMGYKLDRIYELEADAGSATAVWAVLRHALWTVSQRSLIPRWDFRYATSTDCSVRR